MSDFISIESGIRQLYARCVDAVWRQDTQGFADCFSADGEWKIAGHHFRGREEISNGFAGLLSINQRVLMLLGNPLLDMTGRWPSARTYVTELIKRQDGAGVTTMGVYYERFVQQDDRWCFQWRHFDLHYYGPTDLSGAFYSCKDYGPPPAMPEPDSPTHIR